MKSDQNLIALAIILNDDNEVLIVKRKKPERGCDGSSLNWAFPGGRVEDFDTLEETAVEETLEETGYQIEAVRLINKRRHPQFPFKIHYFECRITSEETTQLVDVHEIEQIRWVKPDRLFEYFDTDLDKKVAKFLGL